MVFVDYLAENLDRNTLRLATPEEGEFLNVEYAGDIYTEDQFAVQTYSYRIIDYKIWPGDVSRDENEGIESMTSELHRCYVEAPFEPESMTDSFGLIITLPASDGKPMQFVYDINSASV